MLFWIRGLQYTIVKTVYVDDSHCPDPSSTMKYVDKCPDSKDSWDEAEERKGCQEISPRACNMKYHCVINLDDFRTVELCASPKPIINGNYHGSLVISLLVFSCTMIMFRKTILSIFKN